MKEEDKTYICIEVLKGRCENPYCIHYREHVRQFVTTSRYGEEKYRCYENDYQKKFNEKVAFIKRECAKTKNVHCIEVDSFEYEMLKIIEREEKKKKKK